MFYKVRLYLLLFIAKILFINLDISDWEIEE